MPLPTITLAPWIARVRTATPGEFDTLREACRAANLTRVTPRFPWLRRLEFEFDAELFLEGRVDGVLEEVGAAPKAAADVRESLRIVLASAAARAAEPDPYVACIVADGDRMGVAIDGIGTAAAHRDFSVALSGFASRAREIVESGEVRGSLVYSGGDDVLAFVAVPDALTCADALRAAFEHSMTDALPDTPSESRPTLSVGIGIGHVLDGMGRLLALGRRSERLAKNPDRNGLGVIVQKRAGQTVSWRARWTADPVGRLAADIQNLARGVPSRSKLHEIGGSLRMLPHAEAQLSAPEAEALAQVLQRDTVRTLARSEGQHGDDEAVQDALTPEDVGLDLSALTFSERRVAVENWVGRLLVASAIARSRADT